MFSSPDPLLWTWTNPLQWTESSSNHEEEPGIPLWVIHLIPVAAPASHTYQRPLSLEEASVLRGWGAFWKFYELTRCGFPYRDPSCHVSLHEA